MSYSKRAAPSPSAQSKRQRLSSPHAAYQSSHEDSLSSLSPSNSRISDGENDEEDEEDEGRTRDLGVAASKKIPQKTRPGVVAGKGPRKTGPPPAAAAALASAAVHIASVAAAPSHPTISSKQLPDHQPVPLPPPSASASVESRTSGMVSGKGKKGEDALQKGVAAREEVERRRVEYRGANAAAGDVPAVQPVAAAGAGTSGPAGGSKPREKELVVKSEEGEGGVETLVIPDVEEEIVTVVKKERPAISEERDDIIRFTTVTNDGTPASLILLTGLKNIFQKQLPKMPKEYIARLVYDRNHYSMAIVKRGLEVVGGITYRPFEARRFAEIVFCAITGTEQVKGYGSHLMNHLKDHVKKTTACMHFLTYADNYAIGYFKKQGFSKEVSLDRSVWAGYIKDYEGGTIMHCEMLERIKYLEVASILARQREVILASIRQVSKSHVVHSGLACFRNKVNNGGSGEGPKIDPSDVPGLRESGWTPEMDALTRRPTRGPQFAIMQRLLTVMGDHPSAWAFDHPVNAAEVTDYYDVIKRPMDLATMSRKLEANTYQNLDEFLIDARLIFSNCRAYNDAGSNYVKFANKLEIYMNDQLKIYLE